MATSAAAKLHILAHATLLPDAAADPGAVNELELKVENNAGGRFWTQGTASGNVDRVYKRIRTMTSGQTHSYNLLAAGSLLDVLGQAIDADELKGLVIKNVSGSIALEAPAANSIGIFTDATDLINIASGHTIAFDFGATGLDVTTNSKFDIVEKGASTAAYELWLIVAQ